MKTVVVLADRLDNSAQAPLEAALEYCVDGDVWLDASGVEFLGGRCLEYLISARKSIAANGGRLAILDATERFRDHLEILGLTADHLQHKGAEHVG